MENGENTPNSNHRLTECSPERMCHLVTRKEKSRNEFIGMHVCEPILYRFAGHVQCFLSFMSLYQDYENIFLLSLHIYFIFILFFSPSKDESSELDEFIRIINWHAVLN